MQSSKFDFTDVAVVENTAATGLAETIKSFGFYQVTSVGATDNSVPTIANRFPSFGPIGALKSAVLWSTNFDLYFFDPSDSENWAAYIEEKPPSQVPIRFGDDSLTSYWPSNYRRSDLAKLQLDGLSRSEFWAAISEES